MFPALLVAVCACDHASTTAPAPAGGEDSDVKLTIAKRKDLSGALEAARGKVVVVDVWGEF
jgi:hypothetical protein